MNAIRTEQIISSGNTYTFTRYDNVDMVTRRAPMEALHIRIYNDNGQRDNSLIINDLIIKNPQLINWRNLSNGVTPLTVAIFAENIASIENLLKNGASPFIPDNYFVTPWDHAQIRNHPGIISTFKKYYPKKLSVGRVRPEEQISHLSMELSRMTVDYQLLRAQHNATLQQQEESKQPSHP